MLHAGARDTLARTVFDRVLLKQIPSSVVQICVRARVRVRSVCTTRSAGLSQASVGCDTAEVQDHGDVLDLLCRAKPFVPCIRAELLSPQLHFHASFMSLMIFYLCFSLGLRG